MKKLFLVLAAIALLCMGCVAQATTVTWKGLTWTMYGADTTAVVNGSGGLDITVLGGQSGDPDPDNWVLHSLLPTNLTQANAPWIEFKIQDAYAGDPAVGGPRGFVDTDVNSWNTETMWQGGIYAGYSTYYLNHNVYDAPSGGWANDPNDWYTGPTRTGGEHTIKFGMGTSGNVDMFFDGVLGMTIPASSNCTLFKRMYLGVSTAPGATFTATYNDLQWGTGYVNVVPEPSSIIVLVGGLGSLLTFRRRKA
ncbi:MAG: PEP-CTERM sorting domain-containing protein [Armatimonadota bacterium]